MQADASINKRKTTNLAPRKEEQHKHVFASAVTRMVFKRGRLTVPPQRALDICGLLSATTSESPTELSHMGARTESTELATDCHELTQGEIESYKEANLPIVRLERGWDAVRELFREEECVLAKYGDLMW